jgi:hypothetical protein
MLFYLGLWAWVNGGRSGEEPPQIFADGADEKKDRSRTVRDVLSNIGQQLLIGIFPVKL